ncbi:MAG: hypothetical protein ACK5B9_04525 [Flavobacteriia bacterium]|jgi:hypothetical protein
MRNNAKLISFIIALKRYRLNSVLLKHKSSKIAPKFNLSVTTFNNYIEKCIELGWINFDGEKYHIKRLQDILIDFNSRTNLFFSNHKVLKNKKTINFKIVLKEIEQILLIDNVIAPQQHQIDKKTEFINNYNILTSPTVAKRGRTSSNQLKMIKSGLRGAGREIEKMVYNDSIVTSARHTASVLGVSVAKANKMLNYGGKVKRVIVQKWVHGISFIKIEQLKLQYPGACIIPYVHYNKIKVCLGSSLFIG